MAARKLLVKLFSAKPSGVRTIPRAHFIASRVSEQHQYALVCETQPLTTFRCHGITARCPACGAQIQSKENTNVDQQR